MLIKKCEMTLYLRMKDKGETLVILITFVYTTGHEQLLLTQFVANTGVFAFCFVIFV